MPARIVSSWGCRIWERMHSRLTSVFASVTLPNALRKAAPGEEDWDGWEFIGEDWALGSDVLVGWECWLALCGVGTSFPGWASGGHSPYIGILVRIT